MEFPREYLDPKKVREKALKHQDARPTVRVAIYVGPFFEVCPNPMDNIIKKCADDMYKKKYYIRKEELLMDKTDFDDPKNWN